MCMIVRGIWNYFINTYNKMHVYFDRAVGAVELLSECVRIYAV